MSNPAIIREFVEVVLNQQQIDRAGEFFHEDVVELVPFPGQGPGLAGVQDVIRGFAAAFPDMHWTVAEQISEGDKVVTRLEWAGTHRGDFAGVPATGKSVGSWGIVIDQLQDGKVKETRILLDTLSLMAQLGALE